MPFSRLNSIFNSLVKGFGFAFTAVINTEKQVQSIRDDILEMYNLTPSYTRQMEWFDE